MPRRFLRMLITGFTFNKVLEHYYVSTYTNTSNFRIILFDTYFVHTLECVLYASRLLVWYLCIGQNGIPISFNTNMVIAGHTGRIPQFWLEIPNPLKIWVQKIYRPAHIKSLWVNLILGLKHQNSHNMGYEPDIKIPISDP